MSDKTIIMFPNKTCIRHYSIEGRNESRIRQCAIQFIYSSLDRAREWWRYRRNSWWCESWEAKRECWSDASYHPPTWIYSSSIDLHDQKTVWISSMRVKICNKELDREQRLFRRNVWVWGRRRLVSAPQRICHGGTLWKLVEKRVGPFSLSLTSSPNSV